MNGVSVYPGHFLQNAPTWQVEKQARRSVILRYFYVSATSHNLTTDHHIN